MNAILIISPRYFPAVCGVGDHSNNLQRYWQQKGYLVFIATLAPQSAAQGVFVLPEKEIERAGFLALLIQKHTIKYVIWQYSMYALHPQGTPWWVVSAVRTLAGPGVQQAIYFHEVQIRYSVPGLFNKFRGFQQNRIANALARLCKGRVATSIPFYLQYFAAEKPVCIPVPPNIPVTERAAATAVIKIVAFANRALPCVVQALAQVQQQQPELEVVWLGKIAEEEREQLTANMATAGLQARVTGVIALEQLAAELQTATLVLLPQPLGKKGEGGISLKNGTLGAAMAAGQPVIATSGDMTDTGQLVHSHSIHLLSKNTAQSWSLAIRQVLDDSSYRAKLGQEAFQFYTNHLTWQIVGSQLEKLLME